MDIAFNINSEDLVTKLFEDLSKDELFNFIVKLDLCVAEYDFTERLRNHFIKEIEKEDEIAKKNAETMQN